MFSNFTRRNITHAIQYLSSNLSLSDTIVRRYALKSDLKIKWVRPEKIPSYKPEKSGDLEPLKPINASEFAWPFMHSKELESASEIVKKIFTLKYQPRQYTTYLAKAELLKSVQRHSLDKDSAESRIADMTTTIRNLQKLMEEFPRNKRMKVCLKEQIERRKKHLKFLRRADYKRFEWLLEKLNIVYKPPPSFFEKVTRKRSLRKLTDKHCNDLKQQRLDDYKAKLHAEKVDFLRDKVEKLQWIRKEEEECGVEPTVTELDIQQVLTQLKEVELSEGNNVTIKDKIKQMHSK